jgi:hypothetical protein
MRTLCVYDLVPVGGGIVMQKVHESRVLNYLTRQCLRCSVASVWRGMDVSHPGTQYYNHSDKSCIQPHPWSWHSNSAKR